MAWHKTVGNSRALAMESSQSCVKPVMYVITSYQWLRASNSSALAMGSSQPWAKPVMYVVT